MSRGKTEEAVSDEAGAAPSLLRNISWLGIANILVKPVWFVFITAACMRLLGVHEYGVMSAALSLGVIASAFVDLGMAQYTVREVSRSPEDASLYFSNFMALRFANSLLAFGAAAVAALILGYQGTAFAAVLFAGGYALTLNLTNYCRSIYRAFEDLRQEAGMLILEKFLVVGAGFLLLLTTRLASWTLAGMAIGMAATTLANVLWIDRKLASIRLRLVSMAFLKRSLRIMVPFGVAGLFTAIYYRVDMVMIEAILGEAPTGQYGAAYRILEALLMLPSIVALAAVYPRLSRLHHEKAYAAFRRVLRTSLTGSVAVGLIITVLLMLFAAPIIRILDPDPAYGPSVAALQILVWSFPFVCANHLLFAALYSMDHQRFVSAALALAVVLNVGLNFILIPAMGINGAAFATIAPEVLLLGIYSGRYLYRKPTLDASLDRPRS